MLAGLVCCKSRPADVITPNGPHDTPTHQTTLQFIMFDSTWRNDSTNTEIDYGINRSTTILIDSAQHYMVYGVDTYTLKAGETSIYEGYHKWPYDYSDITLYPDTIRFFGTVQKNPYNSQTDHVTGYKVK